MEEKAKSLKRSIDREKETENDTKKDASKVCLLPTQYLK